MKNIKDYLPLYTGCRISTPYGECKFLYYKFDCDNKRYNPVLVDRGDNHFAFTLEEVKLILCQIDNITEGVAIECIKIFDKGLSTEPEFKIIGKDGKDWVYVEVGYENTECCWEPKIDHLSSDLFRILLSEGVDLFNLIPEGLAIDATTIKTHEHN